MLAEGSWWLRSKSDPRWNVDGRDLVGMFMTVDMCPPAKSALIAKKAELGDPPDDLEFGYMKD